MSATACCTRSNINIYIPLSVCVRFLAAHIIKPTHIIQRKRAHSSTQSNATKLYLVAVFSSCCTCRFSICLMILLWPSNYHFIILIWVCVCCVCATTCMFEVTWCRKMMDPQKIGGEGVQKQTSKKRSSSQSTTKRNTKLQII